jgi:uncharacterized protein (TIGR02302 family)
LTKIPTRRPPPNDRPPRSASARRLDRLVGLATAAAFWERLWRGLIPPLVVVGLFLCVSWLGLWLEVPHLARLAGLVLFALLLLVSCYGLLGLAPLSRRAALRRIDEASGLEHRPATVLEDTLATTGRDPATDALWSIHMRRAEAETAKLRAGRPSPRAVDLDRYALRGGIVVAVLACAIIAGPQRYALVAAAFDVGGDAGAGPGYRIDAWIDPPAYTGKAPILLDLASDAARDPLRPVKVSAPAGSVVVIRSSGGAPAEIETGGALLAPVKTPDEAKAKDGRAETRDGDKTETKDRIAADAPVPAVPGDAETRLVLHGDSHLTLRHGGALRGTFDLTAIADRPPTIMLRELPKTNVRGSLTLAYTVGDDYGVSGAQALFSDPMLDGEPIEGPPLVAAPKVALSLPGLQNGLGDAETTADLSESPWAGAQVKMTLVAHDEGGNEGRSDPVTITLPQKPFVNPLARALVEQRRNLVMNPGHRAEIDSALSALMVAPAAFGTTASVYLGLRYAEQSLAHAEDNGQLVAVADFLWGMALQLENGDLSDAEKALRNAEKELRDAIDRKAPDEEIQRLTQNLQAAMDKFLKELAEQQNKDQSQQAENKGGRPSKSISQKDLQKLIDRLKEQARSGNREEAKKALDELQDVLENLKTAKRQKPDPQSRAMAEGMNQLDQAMRDQQDLRDETFKQGQQGQQGQQGNQQQGKSDDDDDQTSPGGMGQRPGQGQNGQSGGGGSPKGGAGKSGQAGQKGQGLRERQQALRDRLAEIQKKLKQAGEGAGDLDQAEKEMREAEDELRQGEGANGQAVDSQGRALDAMRKGAKKLADAMNKQGDPNGQANGDGEGGESSPDAQQTGDTDPLGRPNRSKGLDSSSAFNPMGIPAAQRAQRVLEELRKRLGDPMRSQEEIDYLERLLRSY